MRSALGRTIGAIPERSLRFLLRSDDSRIGEKIRRVAFALQAANIDDASLAIDTVGLAGHLVKNASNPTRLPRLSGAIQNDSISRMQLNDSIGYLPDDILTKVDRCSMAVSLEAREPLLDHRVVEFVWSLPATIRRNFAYPKALLRSVLRRYVPDALTERSKHGFSVPLDSWLRGPLRPWAEDMLSEARLNSDGIFDSGRVRAVWQRHLSGTETNATGLWNILMMQSWMRRWMYP
jgi:asparagine synthase (glutamine-hydrolysing)